MLKLHLVSDKGNKVNVTASKKNSNNRQMYIEVNVQIEVGLIFFSEWGGLFLHYKKNYLHV